MSHLKVVLQLLPLPLLLQSGSEIQSTVLLWGVWAELQSQHRKKKAQALDRKGWIAEGRDFHLEG